MKKPTRILTTAVAATLAASLFAGCVQTPSSSAPSPSAGGGAATSAAQKVTLTYSANKDTTPAARAIIDAFEAKNPNIKVNLQELPSSSDQVHNALVTAFSAGDSSIDVFNMDIIWAPEFGSAGWALPLDKYFTKDEQAKFLTGPIKSLNYNGVTYAVPRWLDSGLLYYRSDIIKTPPKTWAELVQMSKDNIGKNGIKNGFVFQGSQYEGFICDILEYINGNGGSVLTGDKVTVNDPKVKQGIQTMKDIFSNGIAPAGITTYKETESLNVFQQGDTLFMRNWSYAWALLQADTSVVKGKIGVTSVPYGPTGTQSAPTLGGWNTGISKFSKHPDEAWKFVEFLAGEESQKINAMQGGRLPTRMSLYKDADINKKNPYWTDMYNGFVNSTPRPVNPQYPKMSDSMQINFQKAVTNQLPIDDAVTNVEKDFNAILAAQKK